jgi:hypothetical protein
VIKKRKGDSERRDCTLIFRVSKAEYGQFDEEAKRRHMEKSELLRHLCALYFVERIIPSKNAARETGSQKDC